MTLVAASPTDRAAIPLVREQVRDLLLRTPAYQALPDAEKRQLAHDMVNVAQYMVDAGGQTAGVPLGAAITGDATKALGSNVARAFAGEDGPDTAGQKLGDRAGPLRPRPGPRPCRTWWPMSTSPTSSPS